MGLITKNVILALLLSYMISPQSIYSQNQTCTISSPDEPELVMASRYPSAVEETNHFLATKSWEGLENARVADEQYLSVDLERYDRTHIIRFSNFGFNVPDHASIEGLRIAFEGRSIGEGKVRQMQLQFYTNGPVGEDRSQLPSLLGHEWINDSLAYDRWWKYGHFQDTWGKNWTPSEINSSDFGFVIQIENQTDSLIQAIIDQVRISVYYTPPFNICDHECVVFSTDPINGVTNYNWTFPSIFEQIVSPVNQEILNLTILDNVPGSYEVCVTPEGQSQCCREFVIIDCSPGSVGNRVWKDSNNNGIQDADEIGIPNVRVQLFNESGFFLEDQFTDNNGYYFFDELNTGNYKIKTSPPSDDCNLSANQGGDENMDSDYDLAYGPRNSGVFHIAPGQHRDDIDFGWVSKFGSLSGCVFRDRNGDSLLEGDPGIGNVTIQLFTCDSTFVSSVVSDENGLYKFESLVPGEYYIATSIYPGFISASGGDSSFGVDSYSSGCVEVVPNGEPVLKLGFIPLGSIGNYVFYDENSNGLQDSGLDWPIEDISVSLLDAANNIIKTTITNIEGIYLFTDLPAGDYSIIVNYPSIFYLPTIISAGDSELDSEGVDIGNLQVQSGIINLFDGEAELDHDFGFIKRTTAIEGTYVRDSNGDGFLDGEPGIPNVSVYLYNCDGPLIATRTTDENGNFSFIGFVGDDYHLVFSPVVGSMTSSLGESSIDNIFEEGATSCFNVLDETTITLNGAAVPFSRVGDTVWEDLNRDGLYNDGEPGMANIEITLFNSNNEEVARTLTNEEGVYIFDNLLPDLCYMVIDAQAGYEITDSNVGLNNSVDSDAIMMDDIIKSEDFLIEDGYQNMDMDFGFRRTGGNISGFLWNDANGDSTFELETAVINRTISLFSCDGNLQSSTMTNNEGLFSFNQIIAGDYYLLVESTDGFIHTIGGDSDLSNAIELGSTSCFTLENGSNEDFILGSIPTSSIGDFIWIDENRNGIQDDTEQGIGDIEISLFDSTGNLITTTQSDIFGNYIFENVPAGNYSLSIEIPTGYDLTESNLGDPSLNSEGTIIGTTVVSPTIELRDGVNQNDHDFGFYLGNGNFEGTVWRDSNGDELFANEFGFEGIAISLYSCELVLIDSQVTDGDGNYSFENIPSGDFFVVVSLPDGYEFALSADSQISNSFMPGSTDCTTVSSNNSNFVNIGLIPLSEIGDFVWFDENKNGIQDLTETGFANLDIGLLNEQGALLEVTQTDEEGKYLFKDLRPGQYNISVTLPGDEYTSTLPLAGADDQLDSEGILDNGSLVSEPIDLYDGINQLNHDFGFILLEVEPEFGNISGSYKRDRNGDGILSDEPGIDNVTITLVDCTGTIIATNVTDELGNYNFTSVPPGDYYVHFPSMLNFDYLTFGESQINGILQLGSTDCFTLAANSTVNNINGGSIPLSSIGDYVWNDENRDGIQDASETGLQGIVIELYDSLDVLIGSTTSDENGFYQFIEILPGGYYTSVNISEYKVSPPNVTTDELDSDIFEVDGLAVALVGNLSDGMIVTNVDYGLYQETTGGGGSDENVINGIVFEDLDGNGLYDGGEPRLNDIRVSLITSAGALMDNTITSAGNLGDGFYEFTGFPNLEYTLEFELDGETFATAINAGTNTGLDSDIILDNGVYKTETLDYTSGATMEGVNAGFYYPVSIGDYVWFDFNANGLQDEDEPGANDYIIRLYDGTGQQVLMTTTKTHPTSGENGYYTFNDLRPGDYYIGLNMSFGTSVTTENAGDESLDSDVDNSNGAGTTATLTLISGEENLDTDIGVLSTPGSVGNYLWLDNNGNGIQDTGEPGMNDVGVKLYDENSNLIKETITSDNDTGEAGYYIFENVTAGDYFIVFDLPSGYLPTAAFRGGNASMDSDITGILMPGSSNIFSIGTGVFSDDIDCGIYLPSSIGDYVWDDKDKDGLQKFGEFGVADVEIVLYRVDEGEVDKTTTNQNGVYNFSELRPGEYYFIVEMQDDYQFSAQNQGTNPAMDSNVDMTGTSEVFFLNQDEVILNLDVGLIPAKARLGGRTWIDDGNGLQDFLEESLPGITVNLLDDQMNIVQTTETNVIGRYTFTNLMTTDYFIQFDLPSDYSFTILDASFNDFEDSDARANGLTEVISVDGNTNSLSIDAGYILSGLQEEGGEYLTLTGYHEDGGSTLSWVDENFQAGDTYTLFKSYDGINFTMLDQVTKSNENNLWYQDFSVSLIAEDSYYIVKKYLENKMVSESNIWKDQYLSKYQVNTFPIPTNDVINVSFDLPLDHQVEMKILDLLGNEIQSQVYDQVKAGNASLRMDLDNIPNGYYILVIDFGIVIKTSKISVIR